jgi:cellulose synthase/poly-beta-1,6-N-acetylglucosamine synthase-like glycosyltransferase
MLLLEIFEGLFLLFSLVMVVYMVRHYIFTLSVLRRTNRIDTPQRAENENKFEPTVSILIPACNEEYVIGNLLQRMVDLTYPRDKLQVTLIDDASSDSTGEIAEKFASKHSFIQVLHRDKTRGGIGKAAALNYGLTHSTGDIVLCFDADYYPQRDIVEKLVKEFADPIVGAVQGRPVVLNESQNYVTRIVTLERIGGFRVDQQARDALGLIPQFGGTVGGFRRGILEKLGGFDEAMITEDTDLTFRIILMGYKVRYVADAECYEEAVCTWKAYWRQRSRWARGHMQVSFKHAFNVVKSNKLNAKEKIDGLLLLNVYFVPVVTLFAFFIGTVLVVYDYSLLVESLWFILPVSLYSCVGNFAPFFEVGVGVYLDGRKRLQWLVPLLIFAYFYNIAICTKALVDVFAIKVLRKKQGDWAKTTHLGDFSR